MAIMEFQYLGQTDQAIQDSVYVLQKNPDHLQANFNLGIFYWQGRHDYACRRGPVQQGDRADQGRRRAATDPARTRRIELKAMQQEAAKASTESSGTTSTGGAK